MLNVNSATFETDLTRYRDLYKHIHAHPELSNCEQKTAELIVEELKRLANAHLRIEENIGGFGVAAYDSNGDGKTVLLRADMDALPVEENTLLAYASHKRMKDANGVEQAVMHACGHDMHIACLLAAAAWMSANRSSWSGTVVYLFQPAEERGTGAEAMVNDGLYTRRGVPTPDVVVSGHVVPARAGVVATNNGTFARSARNLKVTVFGRGGHASRPDAFFNPVDLVVEAIAKVAEINKRYPNDECSAVCTTVHAGGAAENVVADSATFTLDIRALDAQQEEEMLSSVKKAIGEVCQKGPKPADIVETRRFPVTTNDTGVYEKVDSAFAGYFGRHVDAYSGDFPIIPFSEDFSTLATSVNRPSLMFVWGAIDEERYDKAKADDRVAEDIPTNHSALFAPTIDPTLARGMQAYCLSALSLLRH